MKSRRAHALRVLSDDEVYHSDVQITSLGLTDDGGALRISLLVTLEYRKAATTKLR